MSYGPDPFDNFRRSASYVDRNLQVSQAGRSSRSAANEVPPSFGKSLFAPDWVVAHAVAVEPVSASKFPSNWEINSSRTPSKSRLQRQSLGRLASNLALQNTYANVSQVEYQALVHIPGTSSKPICSNGIPASSL